MVALLLAVPVAIGVALFITQYAPRRLAKPVGYLIDLLAAIPSIIYGLWGIRVLGPVIAGEDSGVRSFLEDALGWFPLFSADLGVAGDGVPCRHRARDHDPADRHGHQPRGVRPDAAAQQGGGTRARRHPLGDDPHRGAAVRPPGVISASMLGLGRALGETIAVTIILSQPSSLDKFDLSVFYGGETFASKIANNASEFSTPQKTGAYIAAGLVLFVITFAVNAVARWVISRNARED